MTHHQSLEDEARTVAQESLDDLLADVTSGAVGGTAPLSFSLIGPSIAERRIELLADYDLLWIVADPLTSTLWDDLHLTLQRLGGHCTDRVGVTYAVADGPLKIASDAPATVFLHVILHTERTYGESPLLLMKYSWQHDAQTILGVPPGKICPIERVSREMLLDAPMGLRDSMRRSQSLSSSALIWRRADSGEWELAPQDIPCEEPEEQLELLLYLILRAASNTLKYWRGPGFHCGISRDDMLAFEKRATRLASRRTASQAVAAKRALRRRGTEPVAASLVEEWQNRCHTFLGDLARLVSENPAS